MTNSNGLYARVLRLVPDADPFLPRLLDVPVVVVDVLQLLFDAVALRVVLAGDTVALLVVAGGNAFPQLRLDASWP